MPWSLAAWNILPSTSMLTALVHSSKSANFGLKERNREKGVRVEERKGVRVEERRE